MAITDTLVLPDDALLTPLAELPAELRQRMPWVENGVVLGRARVRASSKVIGPDAAELLRRFRQPMRIVDAVVAQGRDRGDDPDQVLVASLPLLRACHDASFLVAADSAEARRILPALEKGEHLGGHVISRNVAVLEDTELYQVRGRHGVVRALKIARRGAEARLAAVLEHERQVLEHLGGRDAPRFRAAGTFEELPWLLMDWRAGVPVTTRARELRSGADDELVALLVTVARAYARLHERGVIHGDVHGGNMLVTAAGRVSLLDFGCSHLAGGRRMPRGVVLPYCDPVLAAALLAGRPAPPLTAEAEQYALAALLYELATGAPHVDGGVDRALLLRSLVHARPLPFAAHAAASWPALESILARGLQRDPARRFPSVAAMAGALEGCAPRARTAKVVRTGLGRTRAWLARLDQRTPREWADGLRSLRCTVMHGLAGTAFGLYRLALLGDDAGLLAGASAWCELAREASDHPGAWQGHRPGSDAGVGAAGSPWFGSAGLILVDAHIAHASGQLARLADCAGRYCAIDTDGEGRLELGQGLGGTLLGAVMLLELLRGQAGSARSPLEAFAQRLATRLERSLGLLDHFPLAGPLQNAGIIHGWGGVLYTLLRWAAVTASEPSAEVQRALLQLSRLAEPRGRGVQFPHVPRTGDYHDIPGWCNGPAGLVHLWCAAWRATGAARFAELAERCAWSAWEAPDRFADLCCGRTGRSYALLAVHRMTGDAAWHQRARRLALETTLSSMRGATSFLSLYKGRLGPALLERELEVPARSCHPMFESEGWPVMRGHSLG
jgi:serine/threonine-protein kinase